MFDLTRKEKRFLFFLIVSFVVGMGLKVYRERWAPLPTIDAEQIGVAEFQISESLQTSVLFNAKKTLDSCVYINRATCEELQKLPGIGPIIAKRIFDYRCEKGEFCSVDELSKIKGIGLKTLNRLKPFVRIK